MQDKSLLDKIMPKEIVATINNRQRFFLRYTLAVLVDLAVLSFFNEFWSKVYIESFSIAFIAAIVLQVLLRLTVKLEHSLAEYFKKKEGKKAKVQRFFSTWAVLFFSKLIILEALDLMLGDSIVFSGALHGLIAFIVGIVRTS